MDSELENFIQLIEKVFYEKGVSCNVQKELPCNCLTGLGLNFWGYVIKNCWRIEIESTLQIKGDVKYIISAHKGKKLIAVFCDESVENCLLSNRICEKEGVAKDKIYLRGDVAHFSDPGEIGNEYGKRIMESQSAADFLMHLTAAVRTQPLSKESSVLFAAVMFFFPNRTLKLVLDYLNCEETTEEDKKHIKKFFDKYNHFIHKLDSSNQYGFLSKFSQLFSELTGAYIGEWISETFIHKDKEKELSIEFYVETLRAAHENNRAEMSRRTSPYWKIRRICG